MGWTMEEAVFVIARYDCAKVPNFKQANQMKKTIVCPGQRSPPFGERNGQLFEQHFRGLVVRPF
jgi:hypothetical protein